MVRDFSNSNNCYIGFRTKRISDSIKKIGSYFSKLKNTISSFQRDVTSVTDNIDIEKEINNPKVKKKENNKEDNE